MSFKAKDAAIEARALEVQAFHCIADLSQSAAGATDHPNVVLSGVAATKTITLDVGEAISKCVVVRVTNRATGAVVALTGAPDISVANKISVIAVGTSVTSAHVEVLYIVA